MSDHFPPSWPRLAVEDSVVELQALVGHSAVSARSLVDLSVDGLRFYPTAPARITRADLESLRASVLAIAALHGHPSSLSNPVDFDRRLAVLFIDSVSMLPVEAANPEIWAFLALRVVPDVVIWRWPLQLEDGEPRDADDDGEDGAYDRPALVIPRRERILGGRRGMLREAWWRGRLLGADACERMPEADNFIQLTDRISLTGDARIARFLVDAHLKRIDTPGYSARNALRRALVLVGRAFGRLSVDAIPDDDARRVIDDAFDRAAVDTSKATTTETALKPAPKPRKAEPSPGAALRERFLARASPYADALESAMVVVSYGAITQLRRRAEAHIKKLGGSEIGRRLVADLTEFVEEWPDLDDHEKAAVHAALVYVIESADARIDSGPEGLVDDDEVVQALFDSLDRQRPSV